ncbi:C45 family autoproteolytic acyltransferase/hydolase [Haloprofundus salinisoli]|uniref:C45 family autoproteolytic acyltransferase/hydolase n=1 Tax=Haloprofundus salinisoli TaxID=2876193 RepID=UPI001CCA43CB|nr:C45 family peptidase [Haloprofundus salinisoli]
MLRRLELSGGPHDRGITHGEELRNEIQANVETYVDRFSKLGLDETALRERTDRYLSLIESCDEAYATEMRAIADGSGLPLEDIVLLNARYEIRYAAAARQAKNTSKNTGSESNDPDVTGTDGCTSFGIQSERTDNDHSYLGQNWDFIPGLELFMMDVRRDGGPNHIALSEAGIVGGKIGVNEAGIGMVINGLASSRDGDDPYRTPFHVRCRKVLSADRLDVALRPLITEDWTCSANFMIGHSVGEMLDVEVAPRSVNYHYPTDHLLVHANHFEAQDDVESMLERLNPHTLCRAPRLKRLLSGHDVLDEAKMVGALRDHFGHPASICKHPDESLPKHRWFRTNASVVIDLTERRMRVADGPPCESEYHEYRVAE